MKKSDFEITEHMPLDGFRVEMYNQFQEKYKTLGEGLAIMFLYNLGKLHGIRQERKRRKRNNGRTSTHD